MSNGIERASEKTKVLKQMLEGERYVGLQRQSNPDNEKAYAKAMNIPGMLKEQQGGQCSWKSEQGSRKRTERQQKSW